MPSGGPQAPAVSVARAPWKALIRWQRAAGPFWPYVAATPFLSAAASAKPPGDPGPDTAPEGLQPAAGEALFLDLPPARTLPLAAAWNAYGLAVAPVIHRWCADPATVQSAGLIAQLIACAVALRRPVIPGRAVFLLDADRSGVPALSRRKGGLRAFDNRYRYSTNAFPSPAGLRRHGITRTRLVSSGEPGQDLWTYLTALERGGLAPVLERCASF